MLQRTATLLSAKLLVVKLPTITIKLLAVLGAGLLLGACTLLPATEPVQNWTLTPTGTEGASGAVQMSGLRVLRPQTQDLLGGSHMLVIPGEGQPVSVYKGARWSANTPTLWRDYLVAALQRDSRFSRVSSDEPRIAADYELVSRLDAFQSEYRDGQPVAVMRAYLQLVDSDSRAIIAERPLELAHAATGKETAAVAAAFSTLMSDATEQIIDWLLTVELRLDDPA